MEKKFGFSWLPCILVIKLKDLVTLRSVRNSNSDTLYIRNIEKCLLIKYYIITPKVHMTGFLAGNQL